MPVRDLIFLTVFFACLPACFFRPFWGMLMWTVVSLLNPHAFVWRVGSEFPWAMAVAIPTLAGFVCFSPALNRLLSRETALIVLIWLWFTFTTLHNTQQPEFAPFAADTWMRWGFVSKILLMTVVTVAIVNTWARFRIFVMVAAACLGVLVLKAVPFMVVTGGSFRLYGPTGSMLADNNDLGLALNMTLPMFFCFARMDPSPLVRRVMTFLFFATIPAILFTYSRGALVGLAIVLLFMIMRLPQRFLLIPVLMLAGLFAVFLTPDKWQQRMDFRRDGALIDDSAKSRFNAWTYCWRLVQDYPITGGGFEAFTPELFYRYAPNPKDVHGPHSIYFGVMAEHGFIGLGLYLTIILSCFATLHGVNRHARRTGDDQARGYSQMLQVSLIAFLVSGAFLGRAYFDYYFTIVACTVVLKQLCRDDEALEPAADMEFEEQLA